MKRLLSILIFLSLITCFLPAPQAQASRLVTTYQSPNYDYAPPATRATESNIYEITIPGEKIIIGDTTDKDKATKFTPKVTISRWGESSIALTPQFAEKFASSSLSGDGKILAEGSDIAIAFEATPLNPSFNELGGLDMVLTLKKKPKSNVFTFTYDSLAATAYWQPPLTPEQITGGYERPDYVVNSIAFYGNNRGDYTALGGKNYKTGKIGHLYRMKANGQVWCDWSIQADGSIALTIPQGFLNDPSNYPITITPVGDTFGYTTIGASSDTRTVGSYNQGLTYASHNATAGEVITSFSVHASSTGTGAPKFDMAAYSIVATQLSARLAAGVTLTFSGGTTYVWYTSATVSQAMSAGTTYAVAMGNWVDGAGDHSRVHLDTSSGISQRGAVGILDTSWGYVNNGNDLWSIYATYGLTPPTVTTQLATNVATTSVTGNGNITATSVNCTIRGFQWGTTSGVYTTNVTEDGSFGTGAYTLTLPSLPSSTIIFYRAGAYSGSWAYGSEYVFITLPCDTWPFVSSVEYEPEAYVYHNTTKYFPLQSYHHFDSVESAIWVQSPADYVVTDMFIRIISNNMTDDIPITFRKNGGATSLAVTIPAGQIGYWQDTTHSVYVAASDNICTQVVAPAESDGRCLYIAVSGYKVQAVPGSRFPVRAFDVWILPYNETKYLTISGYQWYEAEEAREQYTVRSPITLSKLRVGVGENTCDGTTNVTVRKNGANATQTVTIPAGTTGIFQDTTHSDSFAAGDNVSIQIVNSGSTTGSVVGNFVEMQCAGNPIAAATNFGGGVGETNYFGLVGATSSLAVTGAFSSNRTNWQYIMPCAMTISNLYVSVWAGGNSVFTVTLQVNNVDTALSVTHTQSYADFIGVVEDRTHSITVQAGDLVNWESVVTGSTGGVNTYYYIGTTWSQTGASGPSVTVSEASSIGVTTATLSGNVTDTGGEDSSVMVYYGTTNGGTTPGAWAYSSAPTSPSQPQGVAAFSLNVTALSPATFYYFAASANNSYGTSWATSGNFTTGADTPTVTLSAATSVEATTATLSGNLAYTGGENCTITVYYGTTNHPGTASGWDSSSAPTTPSQPQGVAAFSLNVTSRDPGTTYYFTASANNSGGTSWPAASLSFITKPAAPTGVAASDGTYTTNITITWTKSTGATDYHVWRDSTDLGSAGDVAIFADTGNAPAITPGTASATDGTSSSYVTLTFSGQSASVGATSTYKVVASNASGNSADSTTDTGYRSVGAVTETWQESSGDAATGFYDISGTTSPFNWTGGPTDGTGRYYRVRVSASGAADAYSTSDRGFMYPYSAPSTPTVDTTGIAGQLVIFNAYMFSIFKFIIVFALIALAYSTKSAWLYSLAFIPSFLFGLSLAKDSTVNSDMFWTGIVFALIGFGCLFKVVIEGLLPAMRKRPK